MSNKKFYYTYYIAYSEACHIIKKLEIALAQHLEELEKIDIDLTNKLSLFLKKSIQITLSASGILKIRPTLTEEEASVVLKEIKKDDSAEIALDLIENTYNNLFPREEND